MKTKHFLNILFFLFMACGLHSQQIIEQQTSLIVKVSADWCPNCGSWGWDFYEHLIEDNDDKAVFLTAHHSGGLMTDAGKELALNYNITYQPFFVVNNDVVNVNQSTSTVRRLEVRSEVDSKSEEVVRAALGMNVSPPDAAGNNDVMASVEFIASTEGTYYLGIYGMEDNIIHFQSQQGNDALHRYVMRDHAEIGDGGVFGVPIVSGSIPAGSRYDFDFEALNVGVDDDLPLGDQQFVGILWKKEGGDYLFVNALRVTGNDFVTVSLDEVNADDKVNFEVFVNQQELVIRPLDENRLGAATVSIFDSNGRLIVRQELNQIENEVGQPIQIGQIPAQILYVNFQTEAGSATKKVFID